MKIRSISHACGDMPVKLGLELFDKLVMPILLYGSEVWGCEIRDRIEAVQRRYCRTLLGVNSQTQNDIVLAECGRLPLYPIYMSRCVKFWLKVVNAHNRYMNACYNNLRILDEHGKTTWATQIKCLLLTFGFGYVWIGLKYYRKVENFLRWNFFIFLDLCIPTNTLEDIWHG